MSVFAYTVMGLLSLIAILPCLHVISKAISSGPEVTAGNIYFWPVGFQLETVKYVLTKTAFPTALKNSLIVTGFGTLISMLTTITGFDIGQTMDTKIRISPAPSTRADSSMLSGRLSK